MGLPMNVTLASGLAVFIGAGLGALLRWVLSLTLPVENGIAYGTLAANWMGAYLVGIAMGWLVQQTGFSPLLRLFCMTGFLGGLTTFSTFSAESLGLIQAGRMGLALLHSSLHLGGSLLLAAAGIWSIQAVSSS